MTSPLIRPLMGPSMKALLHARRQQARLRPRARRGGAGVPAQEVAKGRRDVLIVPARAPRRQRTPANTLARDGVSRCEPPPLRLREAAPHRPAYHGGSLAPRPPSPPAPAPAAARSRSSAASLAMSSSTRTVSRHGPRVRGEFDKSKVWFKVVLGRGQRGGRKGGGRCGRGQRRSRSLCACCW